MNSLDFEQAEIPESPGAIQGRLAVSVPSRRASDGDDGGGSAAITVITKTVAAYTEEDSSVGEQQDQMKAQQEREGTIGDGGRFPPSTQPEALISTSTVLVLESSLVSARQSPRGRARPLRTNPDYESTYVTGNGSRLYGKQIMHQPSRYHFSPS